jgi:hypothetical protein
VFRTEEQIHDPSVRCGAARLTNDSRGPNQAAGARRIEASRDNRSVSEAADPAILALVRHATVYTLIEIARPNEGDKG